MKHFASIFALILLSVSVFSSALAADTAIVTKPEGTKGDTVRLRQKPNGTILINVPFGKEVKVLDEQGEWMKISYNGRTGWMKSDFLSLEDSNDGLLSFDVTGDWYEWYTVDDLLAYQEIPIYEKRRDIDYLLSEELLRPSDGRICSIQLNSNGQYIYDNWTEYEVFISGNDVLCIYDGYGEDSVQIASLGFVNEDTMWYWGTNEYVAVYKRTKPVNSAYISSTMSVDDSEVIEKILDRKMFEFRYDMPEAYVAGIDIRQSIAYLEDWTFGHILNEDTFETLSWEVQEINDKVKMVNCFGILPTNGFINNIGIEFYVQEDATVPLAWSITIKNQVNDSELSLQDALYDNMETGLATIYNDASIAKLLAITYLASDVYVEKETETAYESVINLYRMALHDEDFWEHYSEKELNLYGIQDWVYIEGGTLQYTIYDINQDGYNELLIAGKSGDYFSIIDIYTTNGTRAIRLFGERSFGYRDEIDILENGCLYTHGSSGANNISFEVYSFSSNGHLEEMQAIDYSGSSMTAIEELRKPYENMIINAETAYPWTILQ